jgi:SAM-dependent methyltransferase
MARVDADGREEREYHNLVMRIQRVVRHSVPFSDGVIVISGGDDRLVDLESRPAWHFPLSGEFHAGYHLANGTEAIALLEEVRINRSARFLLVPGTEFWWFHHYPELRRHLESNYRVAFRDDDCVLFALTWPLDAEYRNAGAPDGLPLPPPDLIRLTVAYEDSKHFYESGQQGRSWIEEVLRQKGFDVLSLGSILDFGCGCGRVIRHWKSLSGVRVFGVDYNPHLVAWCQSHLPFGEFAVSDLEGQLAHPDEMLGFAYAISVFTHLDVPFQQACIRELRRVLQPGGLLLLTLHGSTRLQTLSDDERLQYEAGKLVIRRATASGSNACATFHPERYVRDVLADGFDVLAYVPGGAVDVDQDAVLLQKPV